MGFLPRRKFRGNNEYINSLKKNFHNFKKSGWPDSFIYDFIGKMQNEWRHESCYSIVRNKKRKIRKY